MKIVILGAGVVGTAAAYYLGRDGHEVTVIDRQKDVAVETSWGNAGLVSPGDSGRILASRCAFPPTPISTPGRCAF